MANSNTTNRLYVKQVTGENPDTWGNYLNDNWDLLDKNMSQTATVALSGSNVNLTDGNQENLAIKFQGTLIANVIVTMTNKAGFWIVRNTCTMGAYKITLAGYGGATTVDIPASACVLVFSDGSAIYAISHGPNVTAGNVLGRATGSTGGVGLVPLQYTTGGYFGINCTPVSGYAMTAIVPVLLGAYAKVDSGISANLTSVGLTSCEQTANGTTAVNVTHAYTGTQTAVLFRQGNPATTVGSITVSGLTSTAYNTTSDYRLKEGVVPLLDAVSRVRKLRPVRFSFKSDESRRVVDGFLAHEVASVVPEAVTGEKDGAEMQQMDAAKLVPLLAAAIQELSTRVRALEARRVE